MPSYTIVAGDTLWSLSQRYGCTTDELMALNPGIRPEALQIGQVLNLPGTQHGASHNTPSTNTRQSTNGPLLPTRQAPNNARIDTTLSERAPAPIGQLRHFINSAAQATNMPADLIGAVIYQESGGNINVDTTTNPGNFGVDSGVMQVNEHTAAELQRKYPHRFAGLYGTAKEIMLGASYLKDMYDTSADQDWGITLRAYNSGPNGVDKNNLRAKPAGTGDSTYVDKVLLFWVDISQGNSLPADHYESIYGRGF
ncbi:unnamed protein product [Rotaria sp. Silwood2]|nr:unnamed protein product [Rotaria sp. Silwood2]CAF4221366.1 unnamed protein product [Rotaria sp. Silwood2]